MMDRNNVISMLKEGTHEVTFIKKDGTKRVMKASLEPTILQEVSGTTTFSDYLYDNNQIRCVDVEKKSWRSFCLDSVIDFK